MSHVTLLDGDLARISVAASPFPAVELALSLQVLERRSAGPFDLWQSRTLAHLGPPQGESGTRVRLRQITARLPNLIDRIQLLDTFTPSAGAHESGMADGEIELPVSTLNLHSIAPADEGGSSTDLIRELGRYAEAAIKPYWYNFRAALESERAVFGRALLDGGPDELLRTLHVDITWQKPVLTVSDGLTDERRLQGGGIVILPSVFCEQVMIVSLTRQRSLLVHPMSSVSRDMALDAEVHQVRSRSLPNLLGSTRAAILRALRDPYTTTEVARRHRLAPGTVSKHLSVLREAGLVRSRRRANEVLYVVTPLGRALVDPVSVHSSEAC